MFPSHVNGTHLSLDKAGLVLFLSARLCIVAAHLMALAFLRYLLRVAQQQLLTQSFPTWESSIVSLPQLYHPQKMCQAEVVRAGGLPVWQCPRELLQRAWCLPHAGGPWRWPGGSCELHHLLNLLPADCHYPDRGSGVKGTLIPEQSVPDLITKSL